ncbi:ATP-binding cassette domain-containing protein [Nocardia crassostreae]|uniref:ATP-binding cassette domain-containing protein n=1 Tax=Nocardia crassostreae TaxID=53428 RepID=UPI001FE09E18|nr:ATP-binding cassette domain-containing protein [Nocardia crassostreae]
MLFEVDGVTKRFGDTVALDGLTLAAEPGRLLAVLGRNGAGKTTLVRMLATVSHPDRGSVRVHGHDTGRTVFHRRARGGDRGDHGPQADAGGGLRGTHRRSRPSHRGDGMTVTDAVPRRVHLPSATAAVARRVWPSRMSRPRRGSDSWSCHGLSSPAPSCPSTPCPAGCGWSRSISR